MLKLRFAVGLALFVGIITFFISVANDVRPATILYRSIISLSVFGALGYLLGAVVENFLTMKAKDIKSSEQKVDIISEQENAVPNDHVFDPFTPDNFEHISTKD